MRVGTVIDEPDLSDPNLSGRWWIDDVGRYLRHGCVEAGRSARHRAFGYLGMAEIVATSRSVTVRWAVRHVAPAAMMTAAHFLASRAPGTSIDLEYRWGAWSREIFSVETKTGMNPQARALARMASIGRYRHARPYTGTQQAAYDPDRVLHEGGLLAAAFMTWEKSGRAYATGDSEALGSLAPHTLMFREIRNGEQFAFDHIGASTSAVQVFGRDWARTAVGRRCDRSQPDFEYDERVCATYRHVSDTRQPVYDHIRAVIRRAGDEPIWVPYRRLVLPMRDRLGVPVVASVCEVSQDIGIPFMA